MYWKMVGETIIPPQLIFLASTVGLGQLIDVATRVFSLHSLLFGTTPMKLDPDEPHPFYKYIFLDGTGLRQLS
jgi:hypothetical protein